MRLINRPCRRGLVRPALALIVGLSATVALAASVHLKQYRAPTLTDNGLTATVSGALAGLGNGDVTVTVTATGFGSTILTSPGGNAAPGQNKVPFTLVGTQSIPSSEIKNGTVDFSVTTLAPATPTPKQAGAPNDNWTVTLTDVTFTGYTLTVEQGGVTVLTYVSPPL
jgi:hypothetical protein